MSGGSFNYLFIADERELFQKKDDLNDMVTALAALGYAEDAAVETEEILAIMRQAEVRIAARSKRLYDVWHAMEWWHSADSSEDAVKKALAEYRGEAENTRQSAQEGVGSEKGSGAG